MGTDQDWEKWGATDPYFGVFSREQFRADAMSLKRRHEFFASGSEHVANILSDLRHQFDPHFAPRSALDFGSGVARLVIPLARTADRVTGVDISPSMIAEAKRNCAQEGLRNVNFLKSADDRISNLLGVFDLLHSAIVLQHISWSRGRKIIKALAGHVVPGGCMAIQILTKCTAPPIVRALVKLRYAFPPANWWRNLVRARPVFEPAMQLHVYDLGIVTHVLTKLGFVVKHVDTGIPSFRSTYVYAQRGGTESA